MVIEAIEKSGLWGLKERHFAPEKEYSFISPSTGLKVIVQVAEEDRVRIYSYRHDGTFEINSLGKDRINKAHIIIPREGKKPVRLRWK